MPKTPSHDLSLTEAIRTKALAKEIDAPALAQPGWYRLVGEQHHDDARATEADYVASLSTEGRRVYARKQRKRGVPALLAALKAA